MLGNQRRAYNPACQTTPYYCLRILICKRIPCKPSLTNARGRKKEHISTLNLPSFTVFCQKCNYKKISLQFCKSTLTLQNRWSKISSCKTSKTWRIFCSDPSLTPDGVPHQRPLTEILSQVNIPPTNTPKTFSNMLMLIS